MTESVIAAAQQLGLTIGRAGSAHWLSPCPSCGAERRHNARRDRRGAIGVHPCDTHWRCFSCDAGGGAKTLAWLARGSVVHKEAEPVAELPYLAPLDARRFWHDCWPPRACGEVGAWLDKLRIRHGRSARSLNTSVPAWARHWRSDGVRLVLALHDHAGKCRGFVGRNVRAEVFGPKTSSPAGFRKSGLVMADALGVRLLRGLYTGPCVIVEGEKKLLISEHLSQGRWATIGTGSGLWSAELAASIGRASRVLVYTDPDAAGLRYCRAVMRTLASAELRREFVVERGDIVLAGGEHVPDDDGWVAGVVPAYVEALT